MASIHLSYGEEDTKKYFQDLDGMTTVVLEVPNESGLRKLADKLAEAGVDHKLWVEQPEDYPTCLATRPYPKDQVRDRLFLGNDLTPPQGFGFEKSLLLTSRFSSTSRSSSCSRDRRCRWTLGIRPRLEKCTSDIEQSPVI